MRKTILIIVILSILACGVAPRSLKHKKPHLDSLKKATLNRLPYGNNR